MNSFRTTRTQVSLPYITGKRERGVEEENEGCYPPSKRANTNSELGEMTRIFNTICSLEQRLMTCEITIQRQHQQIETLKRENQEQQKMIDSNKSLSKLNKRVCENIDAQMSSVLKYVDERKNAECPDFTGPRIFPEASSHWPIGDGSNILAYTN